MLRATCYPMTTASISAAKAYREAERERIYQATGVRITDAEPLVVPPVVIIHCHQPGCTYAATAKREGQAIRSLAAHLVRHLHVLQEL